MAVERDTSVLIGVVLLYVVCGTGTEALTVSSRGTSINDDNVVSTALNIGFLNFQLAFTAEINPFAEDKCDRFLVIKTDTDGTKIRPTPKGICNGCCRVQSKDVKIMLHTKNNPVEPIQLSRKKRDNYPLLSKNNKVVMYIHGFMEVTAVGNAQVIKNAYLSRNEDYTVIIVDWSDLASFPWYLDAVVNVKIVAAFLTQFLESYIDAGTIPIDNLHIIGFSLGAHVAGFIGKYLRPGLRLRRITGLDPAYPGFQNVGNKYRLTKDDAEFVDIIHTDGGNYGFLEPLGHVDFYPNDGTYFQPGCDYRHLQQRREIQTVLSCSHTRANYLFAESVYSPYNFPSVKCFMPHGRHRQNCDHNDIHYMGFVANKTSSGTYYLVTNKSSPFGRSAFDIRSNGR